MIYLLLMAALAVAYWRMRSSGVSGVRWRIGGGLLALAALAGAGFTAMRGGELKAGLLLAFAVILAVAARWPRPVEAPASPAASGSDMSQEEARAMLGVAADAGEHDIQAAYARLIRRVHPDLGGASGLAAQLNRARDRLLGRNL